MKEKLALCVVEIFAKAIYVSIGDQTSPWKESRSLEASSERR